MNDSDFTTSCTKVCTFGLGEKLFIRVAFYVAAIVGTYGIWLSSPSLALAYAAYVGIGYGLLMRYSVCARCPHVFVANDCLFMPAPLVKLIVAPRQGRLAVWEAGVAVCAVSGTVAIPLYWLADHTALLVTFLVLTGCYFVGLVGRICKKCQVEVCPLNRNNAIH